MDETPIQNPYKPSRFIENPLPVPKRHGRREQNYDHEVPPDKMHYDTPVSDMDDFDIQ